MLKSIAKQKNIFILIIALSVFSFPFIKDTTATLNDIEESINNIFQTKKLDLTLTGIDQNPDYKLNPQSQQSIEYKLKNEGNLIGVYKINFTLGESDENCSGLNLKLDYIDDSNTPITTKEVYNGDLSDFEIEYLDSDPKYNHMLLKGEEEHIYNAILSIPEENADSYQDLSCVFSFKTRLWQANFASSSGYNDEEEVEVKIATDNWESENIEIQESKLEIGSIEEQPLIEPENNVEILTEPQLVIPESSDEQTTDTQLEPEVP